MPEGNINAEVAEHLREHGAPDEAASRQPSRRRIETIETSRPSCSPSWRS